MKSITTIGIDLAKNSFSIYGVDAKGKCVLQKSLNHSGVIKLFSTFPSAWSGWMPVPLQSIGLDKLSVWGTLRTAYTLSQSGTYRNTHHRKWHHHPYSEHPQALYRMVLSGYCLLRHRHQPV